jgi:hypothetical protein
MRKWMWAMILMLSLAVASGLVYAKSQADADNTGKRRIHLPGHWRGATVPKLLPVQSAQVTFGHF